MIRKLKAMILRLRTVAAGLGVRPRQIVLAVTLAAAYAMLEGFGVGMLTPMLSYIEDPASLTETGGRFGIIAGYMGRLGIPINLVTLLLIAFTPVVLRQFVFFANAWYTSLIQRRVSERLRNETFGAIMRADLSFVVKEGEGPLISTLTYQVQRGVSALSYAISLVSIVLLIVVYVAILLILSWQLALIAVVAMAILSVLVKGSITRSRAYGSEAAGLSNEMHSVFGERVTGLRLIKMRAQEDAEEQRVVGLTRAFERTQLKINVSKAAIEVTVDPLLMLALFLVVYVGVEFFDITLSSLGVFLFILLRLNGKAKDLNVGRQALNSNIDSLQLTYRLLDRASKACVIQGGTQPFDGLKDRIELRNLVFKYPGAEDEPPVLNDVSLEIPRGNMIALVGRSGSGKSTMVDLLPRLREATSGDILYDGVSIRDLDLRGLRRNIGFMTQDAVLFNDTIRGNLLYGLEREPSEEELNRALKDSHSLEFIEQLPQGLDTALGDRGVRLSGGQRQRIALARVMLEDPAILILDEPTSALDSESEQYIQQALERMHGNKTLVVIAHRLSTVQHADRIFVVEEGRLVQSGTHEELLAEDGPYRRLFNLQLRA